MKKLITILCFLGVLITSYSQCVTPQPFCTGTTSTFVASTNTTSPSGPNYGCLGSQPNPSWYYLQMQNSGSVNINLQGQSDVDFILWGPFASSSLPCVSTSSLTGGTIVDCSFSASATETINIPQSATSGQVYVLLVTNYANISQTISLGQSNSNPGTGTTNCAIICNVTTGNNGPVCPGNTVNLTSSLVNNGVYSWTGPNGFISNQQNPTVTPPSTPGSYTYNLSVNNGSTTCVSTTTVVVKDPLINPIATQTICVGSQVVLNATGTTLTNIVWSGGITNNTPFIPSTTTTYTVNALSVGCPVSTSTTVTVNPYPIVNAGLDTLICSGDSIILYGSGNWDNGVISGVPFYPINTTLYTLTNTLLGCTSTDGVLITVSQTPTSTFTISDTSGCVPLSVNFNYTGLNSPSLLWDLGNGTTSTSNSVNTNYTNPGCFNVVLTATNIDGCLSTTIVNNAVCTYPNPIADFLVSPTELDLFNSTSQMINLSVNGNTYFWSFGDGSVSNNMNPLHNFPSAPGIYPITLITTSVDGCKDTSYYNITVNDNLIIYIPNTFTPDGDEYNNSWLPVFTSGFDPNDFNLFIYNRWGETIWESKDPNEAWDGTYKGVKCQDGVYVYKIIYGDKKTGEKSMITGHINSIR
jgi:gliding motility-associated-like protein